MKPVDLQARFREPCEQIGFHGFFFQCDAHGLVDDLRAFRKMREVFIRIRSDRFEPFTANDDDTSVIASAYLTDIAPTRRSCLYLG